MIVGSSIIDSSYILFIFKFAILLILAFYAIFALIVIRQVDLMGQTLITPVSPVVKGMAIINAGFALGFFVLSVGLL